MEELADLLEYSKGQIIDEAMALFFKAALETMQGLRVGFLGADFKFREFTSPALSQLEWAMTSPEVISGTREPVAGANTVEKKRPSTLGLRLVSAPLKRRPRRG